MQRPASGTRASLPAQQLPDAHLGTQTASFPTVQPASNLPQAPLFSTPIRLEPKDTSVIAHSPQIGPGLSAAASSSAAPANITSRKATCTHMNLMRIYGPYQCQHCHTVPRLGWVYRCVQDLGDDFVGFRHQHDADFATLLHRRLEQESSKDVTQVSEQMVRRDGSSADQHVSSANEPIALAPTLKPWMQKLASQDFYTPEQLVILQGQRQKVLHCISGSGFARELSKRELENASINDPTMLAVKSSFQRRGTRPLRSYTIAPYWQTPLPAEPTKPVAEPSPNAQPYAVRRTPPLSMVCTYQTCSTCRPASRDRTWQCLASEHFNANEKNFQAPDPSTDNRLLSHPELTKSACYKILNPDPATHYHDILPSDDEEYYDDDYGSGYSSEISPDISSVASLEGTPTNSQFDENRGWESPTFTPHRWHQTPYRDLTTAGRPLRRAMSMDPRLLRSSRGIEHNLHIGLGIGTAGNAASSAGPGATVTDRNPGRTSPPVVQSAVPVPQSEQPVLAAGQRLSRKSSEEVQVADGIAVTEDNIATGDPDIIVQK